MQETFKRFQEWKQLQLLHFACTVADDFRDYGRHYLNLMSSEGSLISKFKRACLLEQRVARVANELSEPVLQVGVIIEFAPSYAMALSLELNCFSLKKTPYLEEEGSCQCQ